MAVIPLRRRSDLLSPGFILAAVALAVVAFAVTFGYINLRDDGPADQALPFPSAIQRILAIDGDTVRYQNRLYRLVGFDTPEEGEAGAV
jgi:hypothetical protein